MNTEELVKELRAEAAIARVFNRDSADKFSKMLDDAANEIERLRKIVASMKPIDIYPE